MWYKALCTLLLLVGLGGSPAFGAEKIKIVASFGILADIATQLGGENVEVSTLVGYNDDPHLYRLRPQDIQAIQKGDIILLNGLGFEPSIEKTVRANARGVVVHVAKHIDKIRVEDVHMHDHNEEHEYESHHEDKHHHEGESHHEDMHHREDMPHHEDKHHHEGESHHEDMHRHDSDHHDDHNESESHYDEEVFYDPHGFQDPLSVKSYAEEITKAYIRHNPKQRQYFSTRLAEFLAEIDGLDASLRAMFAPYQEQSRDKKILIVHGGMDYFARTYGLQFVALEDLSGVSTLSAKKIRDLEKENIIGALKEYGRNPRGLMVAAKQLGIDVADELYVGILGNDISTWKEMITHNGEAIRKVLSQAR